MSYNLKQIRELVGGVKIMAIVKANAYGHGIVEVSRTAVETYADYLGVGFLEEGIHLRNMGFSCPILVLGGILGYQVSQFINHDLDITVSSIESLEMVDEIAFGAGKKARVHLKIDTGMGRIGVWHERAFRFIEHAHRLKNLEVVGLYSHFATADKEADAFAEQQLSRMEALLQRCAEQRIVFPLIHMANSGAILNYKSSWFNMVRPGLLIYGINPLQGAGKPPFRLKPAMQLFSKIVFIKKIPAGFCVSYGQSWLSKKETRVATIPVGYGDGYVRALSNNSEVLIRGRRFPVIGNINMDQLMVDIGLEHEVHVGDEVVLWGRQYQSELPVEEIAVKANTIPYETTSLVNERVPRVFFK